MTMKYVRTHYNVPAKRGGRVIFSGGHQERHGTIKSARGGKLRVQLDGDKHTRVFHPTWEMEYLPETTL